MKKKLTFVLTICQLVALFGSITGCSFEKIQQKRQAKARVNAILKGLKQDEKGTKMVENPEQVSICQWYNNTFLITDFAELGHASDAFDHWRMQGGIFSPIESYTVDKVELIEDSQPVTTFVYGTINGLNYIMRVPEGDTISWEQIPSFVLDVSDPEAEDDDEVKNNEEDR